MLQVVADEVIRILSLGEAQLMPIEEAQICMISAVALRPIDYGTAALRRRSPQKATAELFWPRAGLVPLALRSTHPLQV